MNQVKIIKENIWNITRTLTKIPLPPDFIIQDRSIFKFYDGFIDISAYNEAIIALYYKDKPQEIIKFGVAPKRIDVEYIQRVGTDLIRTKENRNILLEALILSSIPLLKKGCSFTCEKIPFLKAMYDTSTRDPEKKFAYSRAHLKQELDIYTPIRDRYFTKDGILNFKKERVLSILNNYNIIRKKKTIEFPRISKLKEIKPSKKIKVRPKSRVL
ncbi:MAG: hypothetical protein WCF78_00300 [archaeon]